MTDYISTWDDQSQQAINADILDGEESQYDNPMPVFI
jgi:hypothetical protein